jgi:DNA invertase Pin-like site-specific DNA recombinase
MSEKLCSAQLERRAFVYVRQSTGTQVLHNTESTRRQYALVERAVQLGWPREAIEVVDEDQGKSGKSAEGRRGFGRIAKAVADGEAGGVLAVEVSRLARCSDDWRRLLRLCGVAGVAVADEQAIYDPAQADDKLLLDLKGTMSEAELHWLGLRLRGAQRQKARRGELRLSAPTGYVWGGHGFVLDPDEAVQRALRLVFARFRVEPSAWALARWARAEGVQLPTRNACGSAAEPSWQPATVSHLYRLLHNPVYAGAYVYGRRPEQERIIDGQIRRVRESGSDPERWPIVRHGAHPGYITWEEYLQNQEKLRQNIARMGNPHLSAPREGPALLGGLLVCGRCGRQMRPHYASRGTNYFAYVCPGERDRTGVSCWTVPGPAIDAAVEDLFLRTMVPAELDVTLAVEGEVEQQAEDLDAAWRARREQAAYRARNAERRYKAVDPDNRVVARTLEREWEEALRALDEVEQAHERARRERHVPLTPEDRARIRALAQDLPRVWRAKTTTVADRKAMLRLAIEAIALQPVEVPRRVTTVRVQWQGGDVDELQVPRPDFRQAAPRVSEFVLARVREFAGGGLDNEQIAERLNAEGVPTSRGQPWNRWSVKWARRRAGIPPACPDHAHPGPLPDRHPDGRYSVAGAARHLGLPAHVLRHWMRRGLVTASRADFEGHRNAWWVELDDATTNRLEGLIAERRR